jgi:hypothetical protein
MPGLPKPLVDRAGERASPDHRCGRDSQPRKWRAPIQLQIGRQIGVLYVASARFWAIRLRKSSPSGSRGLGVRSALRARPNSDQPVFDDIEYLRRCGGPRAAYRARQLPRPIFIGSSSSTATIPYAAIPLHGRIGHMVTSGTRAHARRCPRSRPRQRHHRPLTGPIFRVSPCADASVVSGHLSARRLISTHRRTPRPLASSALTVR